MKIMVFGAGAVGGYYGGRLAAEGADVTFLVREERARQLADGLKIESPCGNADVPVKLVVPGEAAPPPDIIIIACKAYGLSDAMETIAPHIHSDTVLLPVLNGLNHVPLLASRFSEARIWGGVAHISATLAPDGRILHLGDRHRLTVGPRADDGSLALAERFVEAGQRAGYDSRFGRDILQDLWDKWVLLASLAAATTLMRAPIGQIAAVDGGERLLTALLEEITHIAEAEGHRPDERNLATARAVLTERESTLSASMLRDMRAGGPTEADHVIGDLIRRAEAHGIGASLLGTAWINLQSYEAGRNN